jgi:hypothetical protein
LPPPLVKADNAAMEAEPPKSDPPKRKRRWFQFRLRTLFVLTLITGVAMTWLVAKKERAARQKTAVEVILNDGGLVLYDYQLDAAGKMIRNPELAAPEWLRHLLGDDFFATVIGVRVVADSGLDQLKELRSVRRLEVVRGITAARLEQLRDLGQLQRLWLEDTELTDAQVDHIARLGNLQFLDISGSKVTDAGMKNLAYLVRLEELRLGNTQITGVGLKQLAGLSQLRDLYLEDTSVGDDGVAILSRLSQLEKLDVERTKVTDAGLKELYKALPNCKIAP